MRGWWSRDWETAYIEKENCGRVANGGGDGSGVSSYDGLRGDASRELGAASGGGGGGGALAEISAAVLGIRSRS